MYIYIYLLVKKILLSIKCFILYNILGYINTM